MNRAGAGPVPWMVLGAFAFCHGLNEWLDMAALYLGDSPAFSGVRLVVMTASFVILVEFGRLGLQRLGGPNLPRWPVLAVLAAITIAAATADLRVANDLARYLLALPGGLAAALVLVLQARTMGGRARLWLRVAGCTFGAYGLAAGLVVPASSLTVAGWLSHEVFFASGVPIPLVRGSLATLAGIALWAHDLERSETNGITHRLRRLFWLTSAALMGFALAGYAFTNWMGRLYDADIRDDLASLAARLAPTTAGAVALLLDRAGTVVASSDRNEPGAGASNEQTLACQPIFLEAMAGPAGHSFTFGGDRHPAGDIASAPIRAGTEGPVTGVAAVWTTRDPDRLGPSRFAHAYLVDGRGLVLPAGPPGRESRPWWPMAPKVNTALIFSGRIDPIAEAAMLPIQIVDGNWLILDGSRHLVGRQTVNDQGWSLVLLHTGDATVIARLFGIVVVLLVSILLLGHFTLLRREINEGYQLHQRQRRIEDLLALNERVIAASDRGFLVYCRHGSCLLANLAAAQILGGTLDEVRRLTLGELTHGPGLAGLAAQALATGRSRHLLSNLVTHFGRDVWLDGELVPFANGNETYLLLAFSDASARKAAEDALRQARDQAEAAARARSVFLATMSHELRTPLHSIIGFGEMIASQPLGQISVAVIADYARDIVSSGYHLLDIVNRMLDCVRIESRVMVVEPSVLDVRMVVTHAVREARGRWKRSFSLEVPRGLPLLWADRHAVYQILACLIGNAVRHTPAEGLISILAHPSAEGGLELAVADTGTGIPEHQMVRILNPFEPGAGGAARAAEGLGLGLFLVASLAELHGGRLVLHSVVGVGTTAMVRFPPPSGTTRALTGRGGT